MRAFSALLLAALTANFSEARGDEGVKFAMRNLCGEPIRVYWIGFDNALVEQSTLPIRNSSSLSINSFRSHRFLIWYSRGSEQLSKREARINGTIYVSVIYSLFITLQSRPDPPYSERYAFVHVTCLVTALK
jgi:hypothetical protein